MVCTHGCRKTTTEDLQPSVWLYMKMGVSLQNNLIFLCARLFPVRMSCSPALGRN